MLSPSRHSLLTFGFAALALSMATGCSDQTYVYPDEDAAASNSFELAPVPPPPPSEEVKADFNDPRTQVWRPGHWVYESQRFYWVPGEVLTKPSATAVWSPDRWERRQYGWAFVHGYWE